MSELNNVHWGTWRGDYWQRGGAQAGAGENVTWFSNKGCRPARPSPNPNALSHSLTHSQTPNLLLHPSSPDLLLQIFVNSLGKVASAPRLPRTSQMLFMASDGISSPAAASEFQRSHARVCTCICSVRAKGSVKKKREVWYI